ncbi:MAG TPA: hypothetical protein PK609_00720 [Candidatus Paceibacterota bacterium]|jgi:hypothetical protein|nr:hypothetical protein [Candidatus Paceibacterota bacterium]
MFVQKKTAHQEEETWWVSFLGERLKILLESRQLVSLVLPHPFSVANPSDTGNHQPQQSQSREADVVGSSDVDGQWNGEEGQDQDDWNEHNGCGREVITNKDQSHLRILSGLEILKV